MILLCCLPGLTAAGQQPVALQNGHLRLQWAQTTGGYALKSLAVKKGGTWHTLPRPGGEYTLLYSAVKPDKTPVPVYDGNGKEIKDFPEEKYRYIQSAWKEVVNGVSLNTAGEAFYFRPSSATANGDSIVFKAETAQADIISTWRIDPAYPADVQVRMTLRAKTEGYFSLASPTLVTFRENELAWGGIPGYYQGRYLEKDFIKAGMYMQGIPAKPLVVRERTATTLSPFISNRAQVTLAVIPDPGTARDPWETDKKTHSTWKLGLSLMNRKAELSPTIYHPVLGEDRSFMKKGETVELSFRYSIQPADWYTVYQHAANDIYRFPDFLALKETKRSLTNRILDMHRYLTDDSTSMWRIEDMNGMKIGAQAYLGGVYLSEKDAMKNSDYGAMWMLANIMNDSVLQNSRLPYARNFKLQQQNTSPGFFNGSAAGQYFLYKSKRFTEEWGPYVEPVGLTYYMMMDAGNILLFNPEDAVMKKTLTSAADRLLAWMGKDGSWKVAYDHISKQPLFTEVEDFRPTFYGLVIAYRILKQQKYLDAAKKGADWYIKNAVDEARFLGVCGDARFVPDFATGQSAEALMDLYDITGDKKYKDAAIKTARIYTTSVYTHPVPSTVVKTVNGVQRKDWEISQVGLGFEHGGTIGSANPSGPIVLASHAGMFVRMFALTKDSLFLNMARAAALGRDAFVDSATGVASYYWTNMNKGAGPYPHHAWWQIGWITDYLLAEAELRSEGKVKFPRGFITPKVGPHQAYGFAPGEVNGTQASLLLREGLLQCDNPYLDYYCAINKKEKKLFFILLNNDDAPMRTTLHADYTKVPVTPEKADADIPVTIPPYGIRVITINFR